MLDAYRQALEQVAELGAEDGPIQLVERHRPRPRRLGPRTQEPCDVTVVLHSQYQTAARSARA